MSSPYEAQYVVCREHNKRHSASGVCPDCPGTNLPGVHNSDSHAVEVVTDWGVPS